MTSSRSKGRGFLELRLDVLLVVPPAFAGGLRDDVWHLSRKLGFGVIAERLSPPVGASLFAFSRPFGCSLVLGLASHNLPDFRPYCWRTAGVFVPARPPHIDDSIFVIAVRLLLFVEYSPLSDHNAAVLTD